MDEIRLLQRLQLDEPFSMNPPTRRFQCREATAIKAGKRLGNREVTNHEQHVGIGRGELMVNEVRNTSLAGSGQQSIGQSFEYLRLRYTEDFVLRTLHMSLTGRHLLALTADQKPKSGQTHRSAELSTSQRHDLYRLEVEIYCGILSKSRISPKPMPGGTASSLPATKALRCDRMARVAVNSKVGSVTNLKPMSTSVLRVK